MQQNWQLGIESSGVTACKKSQWSIEELKNMIHCWSGTDKALHVALNLEIRFRKLTFTTVKASCPLFKQRTLAVDQKVKNLTSLIDSQLDLKALADMNDLESVIIASNASWPPRVGDYVIGSFCRWSLSRRSLQCKW